MSAAEIVVFVADISYGDVPRVLNDHFLRSIKPMKLYQRFFIAVAALTLGVLGGVTRTEAQQFGVQPIWANYAVQYVNEFYNPLAGGTPLTVFLDFSGLPNNDDGTASNVPMGFSFDYNGNIYSSVNVNVNGWVSVGPQPISVTPNNNNNLFDQTNPNNTIAPYWGDHFFRTLEPGYHPSQISYLTTAITDPNPNAPAGSLIHTLTVEWKDLNINDKTNPNSIASFQLRILENPMANDLAVPDPRATIEFQYGPIGTGGTVLTVGAAVGAEDSVGFTHINALFPTAAFNGDSTRRNTSRRTDCWPPATCLPGRAIQLVPRHAPYSISGAMVMCYCSKCIIRIPTFEITRTALLRLRTRMRFSFRARQE